MQNQYPHHMAQHTYRPPSHDSSSVSSTASPQAPLPPLANLSSSGPPSRPSSGLNISLPSQNHLPSATPLSGYGRPYDSNSASPADHVPLYAEALPNGVMAGGHMTPGSMGGPGLQSQKRAYRQRRKDPSCDACRERKVKCDATDTSSCTECLSRNVRCQFTKETNRRMSSIKQVQDLEKQLNHARSQIAQLRSMVPKSDLLMDLDTDQSRHPTLNLPDIGSAPKRRKVSPAAHDLSKVRSNLRDYGRGVLKIPPPYRQNGSQPSNPPNAPGFPPKDVCDHLLQQYNTCVHSVIPILHWTTFCEDYNRVYNAQNIQIMPREWGAVLFAVFALGALHSLDPRISRFQDGKSYLISSMKLIDVWQDHFAVDHSRAALLVSMFLYEMNIKSAAWVWLGSATRIAQDIGLHVETGPWPRIEGEMRKRQWWGVYAWDRLLSLELSRPMLIVDEDCDVDLPCPVDDQFIQDNGIFIPATQVQHSSNSLLTTIHVVRSLPHLFRAFKSPVIPGATLEHFDTHLSRCMAAFPSECQLGSNEYLDPRSLSPILYLQNARFLLHRHNLSPSNSPDSRRAALDHCMAVAHETFRFLSRCMQPAPQPANQLSTPPGHDDWQSRLRMAASTFMCTHIWRCTLILLFRGDYRAAMLCIRAMATIGDSRPVNISCGRSIAFFLRCIIDKIRNGEGLALEEDEEMMAYVSGDLQGSTDSSWVWQGSETGMKLSEMEPQHRVVAMDAERNGITNIPSQDDITALPASTALTEAEAKDWGGWEWVEGTVGGLIAEQQQQQQLERQHFHQQQQHQQPPPLQPPPPPFRDAFGGPGFQQASPGLRDLPPLLSPMSGNGTPQPLPLSHSSPPSSSRMAIAHIT